MTYKELLEKRFRGSVKEAAKFSGVEPSQIRTWKCQDFEVVQLKSGEWVRDSKKMVRLG